MATGNDWQPEFTKFVLTSTDDGATWSERPMAGISAPMDVLGMVSTNNSYVAVGALRTAADPSAGPFEPVIATSPDGATWSRSQLPATGEGVVASVTDVDGELLATGRVGDQQEPSMWHSTDSGATWSSVEDSPTMEHLASSAGVVVGTGAGGEDPSVDPSPWFRSGDGARTWTEGDSEVTNGLGDLSWSADSSGFSLVAPRAVADPWASPGVCYADEVVLISRDAVEWQRLDLAALDELYRPSSVVRDESGSTVLLGTTDDTWAAWFWSTDNAAVPTIHPDDRNDEPAYSGPTLVQYRGTLEVGKRYAYPLNIHCGMDRLSEFNDRRWGIAASSPDGSVSGEATEDWPMAAETILGFLTLTEPGRIEYSLDDGTVIAVYEPLPPDTPEYGCD
ncbi:MAG: exo-alpha-sialidase [Microthrixaceae bacterium]